MDRAAFERLFQPHANAVAGRVRGDHDLNPDMRSSKTPRAAAVLVGLVERPDGLTVLFTRRTDHLAAHAGQISFPGGRAEPHDADATATALRETWEEIGLEMDRIQVVGRLDTYLTRTGFTITPIVGLVRPPFTLETDPFEVAEVFETPLDLFLAPDMPKRMGREVFGAVREFYAFPDGDRFIWGATAGMLVNLRDVLLGAVAA